MRAILILGLMLQGCQTQETVSQSEQESERLLRCLRSAPVVIDGIGNTEQESRSLLNAKLARLAVLDDCIASVAITAPRKRIELDPIALTPGDLETDGDTVGEPVAAVESEDESSGDKREEDNLAAVAEEDHADTTEPTKQSGELNEPTGPGGDGEVVVVGEMADSDEAADPIETTADVKTGQAVPYTPAPKNSLWRSLVVTTSKPVSVVHNGVVTSFGTKLKVAGNKGVLQVGSGANEHTDPFAAKIFYFVDEGRVVFSVSSEPWAIIRSADGIGLGRTPIKSVTGGRHTAFELINPQRKGALRIDLTFAY